MKQAPLSFFACSKLPSTIQEESISGFNYAPFFSKSFTNTGGNELMEENFFVTEKDIQAYMKFRSKVTKTELTNSTFSPIVGSIGDTLMYALNYQEGWELIAADKRCRTVLASGNEGSFFLDELIPPVKFWLDCLADEVRQVRSIECYDEVGDAEVIRQMQNSFSFWDMITPDSHVIPPMIAQTKSGLDPIPADDGYWDLYDVVIDTISHLRINHLIQTHWDQNPPYNSYSPLKSNSTTQRAPAGCVAVAAGQVANYFNKLCGYPEEVPLTAFCDAQIPSGGYYQPTTIDSHMYISNFSTDAWDSIPSNGDMCAKLLAEIGIAVNMKYSDSSSESSQFGETYFSDKDFFFTSGAFIKNPLVNNLTSGKPVIVGANTPQIDPLNQPPVMPSSSTAMNIYS